MPAVTLADSAAKLRDLPFPSSPVDPGLGAWMMDLLEADAYYAGLAQSALAGLPIDRPPAKSLASVAEELSRLGVSSAGDEAILEACRSYLEALLTVDAALRS